MAYRLMPNPVVYDQSMRSGGVGIWYTIKATQGATVLASALQPTGGQITDTIKPGVRRTLNLELAAEPGLYDLLAPAGITLTVTAHVQLLNRTVVDIPAGVYDVDSQSLSVTGQKITLTAPDKWQRVVRAKYVKPGFAVPGVEVITQIGAMIREALGASEPINVTAASRGAMVAMGFEEDRAGSILQIAKWTSLWVSFDANGTMTITDTPTIGATANWLIDAGATGVLVELDKTRSRTNTYNVVGVFSSAAEGELFAPQYAWDNDPSSITYAGPDPIGNPAAAGPFGVVPLHIDTPLNMTASDAYTTATGILSQVAGLASQVSLSATINPAIDAGDVIEVVTPGTTTSQITGHAGGEGLGTEPFGTGAFGTGSDGYPLVAPVTTGSTSDRHLVETVTHPLVIDGNTTQHIEARSTRTDEWA